MKRWQKVTHDQLIQIALYENCSDDLKYAACRELQRRQKLDIWKEDPGREIEYDRWGRIKYHPKLHPNHKKKMTVRELIYLCKYHECDGLRAMSYVLGKPEASLTNQITRMKEEGTYRFYRDANFYGFKEDEMKRECAGWILTNIKN